MKLWLSKRNLLPLKISETRPADAHADVLLPQGQRRPSGLGLPAAEPRPAPVPRETVLRRSAPAQADASSRTRPERRPRFPPASTSRSPAGGRARGSPVRKARTRATTALLAAVCRRGVGGSRSRSALSAPAGRPTRSAASALFQFEEGRDRDRPPPPRPGSARKSAAPVLAGRPRSSTPSAGRTRSRPLSRSDLADADRLCSRVYTGTARARLRSPRGFELPLEPRLPRIGSIDQVGVEERAAASRRSIKKDSSSSRSSSRVRMTDLTTLEGGTRRARSRRLRRRPRGRTRPIRPSRPSRRSASTRT